MKSQIQVTATVLTFFLLHPLLFEVAAFADVPQLASDDPVCKIDETTTIREVKFKGAPAFFAKANMDVGQNKFYFRINGRGNVSLDLGTGDLRDLPGAIDPVPSPDGRFLTIPSPIRFFDTNEIVEKGVGASPIFRSELGGVYQSVGSLDISNPERLLYRTITDSNPSRGGMKYSDIRIEKDQNGQMTGTEVVTGRLCQQIDGQDSPPLRLPMISKNGQMLSAYDSVSGSTKIYSIDPKDTKKCTVRVDLGMPTGKVEFNLENDKVAFHIDTRGQGNGSWFAGPKPGQNMNVFVYDLKTQAVTRVTQNMDGNSYYPSFRSDESLVFLHSDTKGKFSAVVADPVRGRSMRIPSACSPSDPVFMKTLALGRLWVNLCSQLAATTTLESTAFQVLSLEPDQCRKMVDAYWSGKNRSKVEQDLARLGRGRGIHSFSKKNLKKICPGVAADVARPVVVEAQIESQSLAPQTMTLSRMIDDCRGCHSVEYGRPRSGNGKVEIFPPEEEMSTNDWLSRDSGNGQPWKDRIRKAVSPGGPMNRHFNEFVPEAEREGLLQELR